MQIKTALGKHLKKYENIGNAGYFPIQKLTTLAGSGLQGIGQQISNNLVVKSEKQMQEKEMKCLYPISY